MENRGDVFRTRVFRGARTALRQGVLRIQWRYRHQRMGASGQGWRKNQVMVGTPVGRALRNWQPALPPEGDPERHSSTVIVVLTMDAPLNTRQLDRFSGRAGGWL
jgi:hypothetical protein